MSADPMKITDSRAMTVLAQQPQPMSPIAGMSPVDTLLNAIQRYPDMDLIKLEKLMELAERWRAAEAKRAYVRAFALFKKNMPDVVKDMLNKQYGSDYSSLANLVNTTSRVLGEYGLHANWRPDQSDGIKLTCVITHEDGHSEEVWLKGPPDTSGQKNPLQQIKSTLTYLEGATFQAITGVVARSACADDDGNGAGSNAQPEVITPDGYAKWRADMKALADEGTERLQDAWQKSDGAFRRHAVDHDELWWGETKRKAAKVKS
jgi:hypothetical protein